MQNAMVNSSIVFALAVVIKGESRKNDMQRDLHKAQGDKRPAKY